MHPFFTPTDLTFFHAHAGQPAISNGVEQTLAEGVWAKTLYWAGAITPLDFTYSARRSVVGQAGTAKDATGQIHRKRIIRPFTWARIFRPGDENYKLFFTVGVDGKRQELVWKLDCLREGGQALDKRLIARFDEFTSQHPHLKWQAIAKSQLRHLTWPEVVQTTRDFITQNAKLYDKALTHVWQGRQPGVDKLARLCWNSNGWQRPSGPQGKSRGKQIHESEEAYGGEEWLFDFSRVWQGNHYGFLRQLNEKAYEGKVFNIRLFTHDAETNTYYYVGRIKQAEVLTARQQKAIITHARKQGWVDRMQEELANYADTNTFLPPFNLRFRPEQVERPEGGMTLIEDISEWTSSQRYVLFDDVGPGEGKAATSHPKLIFNPVTKRGRQARTRSIQAQEQELSALHEQVQDKLVHLLRQQFPKDHVEKEVTLHPAGTFIDVVRRPKKGGNIFYEVKVLSTLKACLREALGQLLEYACWPDAALSREWVVVSYHPLTGEAKKYLALLKKEFSLPIDYLQVEL